MNKLFLPGFADVFPSIATLTDFALTTSEVEFCRCYSGHFLVTDTVQGAALPPAYATARIKVVQPRGGHVLGVAPVVKHNAANPDSSMITIGRSLHNDIILSEISVSKVHALIRCSVEVDGSQRFMISDAGSRNGTFINGESLGGTSRRLAVGARLRLGGAEGWFLDDLGLYGMLRASQRKTTAA